VNFVERIVGDSNGDGLFDQKDIVQILQAGKYNTGQPATFGEGDWTGDGVFDQKDIVAALRAGNFGAAALAALRLGAADVGAVEPQLGHDDNSAASFGASPRSDVDLIFAHLGRTSGSADQRLASDGQPVSNEIGQRAQRQISVGRTNPVESSRSDATETNDSQHVGLSATVVDRLFRR
jgi:hypothetical protein